MYITGSAQKNGAATVSLGAEPDVVTFNCCDHAIAFIEPWEPGNPVNECNRDVATVTQLVNDFILLFGEIISVSVREMPILVADSH